MSNITEKFSCMVFNDSVMREKLPQKTYDALKKTISEGMHLDLEVANAVATAMKDWALEKGVTHFSHWFQPMTGITAEKHDSFLSPDGNGGAIMEFSGKSLIRGEPDASSFPSGGLRATFEARGYTAWDPTSYAFIKEGVLCIPTAFCSYSGEALDKKTPLLRSMQAVEKAALRVLRLFGNRDVKRVIAQAGPEQEYFLIDRDIYLRRPDLIYTGRTLFGARPPRGQEMDDHYFGAIKRRVKSFMTELDEELWKLGIYAKTEHNEAAPAQHEMAPVYSTVNLATDSNQLTMELMKSIAGRHNLVCLLHEKPFAGVNGSGKHNNWSLATDKGVNLFEPGETPNENAQFLLFLCAVIKAVDEYQDLIRASVATAGNDHRLGSNEAPPAIISMFLGEELTAILDSIENDCLYAGQECAQMEIGVTVLPQFPKDTTDRNRTSPFAFTGNKFEFRMPGSTLSVAEPNIALNTAVAETLTGFAETLESGPSFKESLNALIKNTIRSHRRIIFNGNGYDDSWTAEAEKRGLPNLTTTPQALAVLTSGKNMSLFEKHHVFNESEMISRSEIHYENYCKTLHIEALTMIDMVNKYIIPAALSYEKDIAETIIKKKSAAPEMHCELETGLLSRLSTLSDCAGRRLAALNDSLANIDSEKNIAQKAVKYRENVFSAMANLRLCVDELELLVSKKHWTLPTYAEMLYSVNI